ncbi:hypothetical protein MMC18_005349 [Xylographa bjoerkii]|nr:hypothetical protein [Xylographa bjoerkii]
MASSATRKVNRALVAQAERAAKGVRQCTDKPGYSAIRREERPRKRRKVLSSSNTSLYTEWLTYRDRFHQLYAPPWDGQSTWEEHDAAVSAAVIRGDPSGRKKRRSEGRKTRESQWSSGKVWPGRKVTGNWKNGGSGDIDLFSLVPSPDDHSPKSAGWISAAGPPRSLARYSSAPRDSPPSLCGPASRFQFFSLIHNNNCFLLFLSV